MSQHKPEPAYPKLLNLDTKRQTPSTGGLAPTPVITPTLTEHTTEIGAGANTPPYASTATSMTPCDRSCCYNVNPSYGHVTDMSPLSSPSSYAHAPEKPSDDQGSYEYPFGFSNGYHGASPLINNKNICEKDVSVGYSLTDCKWRLLDVLNALLYALLLLGVVLNVNVRVGWWVTGRDGNGGGEERSMLQGASGCDSDGCGGGRMGGVVLDTIRERREVRLR
ncbi:uncharacterized protein EI97DRAFT_436973 [Westerdykella ornata]|uniref:Uncharacterized protein n=1 Tax=Westerdykella ornata TaxID=318751 RepID=A0A6A6J8K7_WESOR|nr:uncharacterized protein EI97DRAFT_436973 [Westerdykella ornata]KAF2272338.1 hypothetical protein EI97DRAFT_436973 [Westerdykella ornata]